MASNKNVTGWVGWAAFAGVVMLLSGVFGVFQGLVALFNNNVLLVAENTTWLVDLTTWGWAHLLVGILLIGAAASVFKGHMFGRVMGVILAVISALVNLAFVPYYPVWAVLVIVVDVLVVYALTVHGAEMQE